MPQMAPMWWTMLFISFNISFLMMMTIIYFQTDLGPKLSKKLTSKTNNLNWKW
uniref:ATP synthase complex subunit 8 n=1 Tax=Macracanthopsis nodipes TaxID=1524518 RepID=A0A342DGV1_9HEMI|nr:ATP synthase F0 subunit 8 [Macracanthopsis nodipes]